MPEAFVEWNRRYGAPAGRGMPGWGGLLNRLPESIRVRLAGCFSIQSNSSTRVFEYPWAYHAAKLHSGMRVLEIGGGLSGFQFVLSRIGCSVTNVDPGLAATGGASLCDLDIMARSNRTFGTNVHLVNTTIDKARLQSDAFDRAFAISVLEHMPEAEIADAMRHVFRALKPGGVFVITLDLFLNVHPFTRRRSNRFGANVDVAALCGMAPFRLLEGAKAELFGFPEFEPGVILSDLDEYVMGEYPVLSQCLVLEKPADSARSG